MRRNLFLLLWGAAASVYAGDSLNVPGDSLPDRGGRVVISGFDREERESRTGLDFSNTICDTLFFDGRIILLDESPLLGYEQEAGLRTDRPEASPRGGEGSREAVEPTAGCRISRPALADVYTCARGYTATWTVEDGRLFLSGVTPCDRKGVPLAGKKKTMKKKPAVWVSGRLQGGSGCVPTHLGYAYKNEYVLFLEKGRVVNSRQTALPVGAYEDETRLLEFLKENFRNEAVNEYLQGVREKTVADPSLYLNLTAWRLVTDTAGTCTLYLDPYERKLELEKLNKNKSMHTAQLLWNLYWARAFPPGSFYGRFLRGGVVLAGIPLQIQVNTAGDLKVVCRWTGNEEATTLH